MMGNVTPAARWRCKALVSPTVERLRYLGEKNIRCHKKRWKREPYCYMHVVWLKQRKDS